MKVVSVVGNRPQFIKAAVVSRAIAEHNKPVTHHSSPVIEVIVHTGQHYDDNMSGIFFRDLEIPGPDYNLEVGSGSHGRQTGEMLGRIEQVLLQEQPDWVIVYGDTNSTLAGALAAAKLHIPVAHVEAGLRSFNRRMPEEVNRILTDHISSLLFCPTHTAVINLANEGITGSVHHVGDVMYDAALVFGKVAERKSNILRGLGLSPRGYLLATVHRAENTDDPVRLKNILTAFNSLSLPVIFPVHPRTKNKIAALRLNNPQYAITNQQFIDPVSFLDMVQLEKYANCILTDSGGVQKEAYFHGVPCVTLRDETEWVETVEAGWNQIAGTDSDRIVAAVCCANTGTPITEYGQGDSSGKILHFLVAQRRDIDHQIT